MSVKSYNLSDGLNEKPKSENASPEEVQKTVESQEQSVPLSQVQALIDKALEQNKGVGINAELISALTQLAQNSAENQKKTYKYDASEYRDPEPGDLLETPKIFWSQRIIMVLGDDRRNGHPFPAPFGPVIFKPVASERRQTGKDKDILIFNKHICQSKKELEFLMNHSLFNSVFFEKVVDIQNSDIRYALTLGRFLNSLKNTDAYRIFEQAKASGIPKETDDVHQMRVLLAQKLAKEQITAEDASQKIRIQSERKEALVLGHKVD